jgi:hypothetical protein
MTEEKKTKRTAGDIRGDIRFAAYQIIINSTAIDCLEPGETREFHERRLASYYQELKQGMEELEKGEES